jgi:hypothetical protein
MSTFTHILVIAGSALIVAWLAVAVCFGIGMFGQRGSMNAARQTAARMFGHTSKPVGRTRWALIFFTAVPLLLFGAAVVIVHLFCSLLGVGWCRLTGRPTAQPPSLEDFDDEDVA